MSDLTPANENPWYVLMTLYGEQEARNVIDPALAERNVRAWNIWSCQALSDGERAKLREHGAEVPEDSAWVSSEREIKDQYRLEMRKRNGGDFECPRLPDINAAVLLEGVAFSKIVFLEKAIFTHYTSFYSAKFGREVSMRRAVFLGRVTFTSATFCQYVDFLDAKFVGSVDFGSAIFNGHSKFEGAEFSQDVRFTNAVFEEGASFGYTMFVEPADFSSVKFCQHIDFFHATFTMEANFDSTTFEGFASFGSATFAQRATFKSATFSRLAEFNSATFSGFTYFIGTKFDLDTTESEGAPSFSECQFEKPANFSNAVFRHRYPDLSGAILHDKTQITAGPEFWPVKTDQSPETAKASCATLRHVVAQQSLPEEEQFFHRREMMFAGQIGPWWARLPYWFYGLFSDYGHSISRPLTWLALLWVIPILVYSSIPAFDHTLLLDNAGFSFANIFKFFGFQSTYFKGVIDQLHPMLKVLTAAQTVLGFIFLFFLGLGLRSRFRLR